MSSIVDVFLPVPSWKPYSYGVVDGQIPEEPQGCRVVVSVRGGWKVGICWRVRDADPAEEVAPIREFLDSTPIIPPDLWDLCTWMSSYYMCPPGIVLSSVVPGPCRGRVEAALEAGPGLASCNENDAPEQVRPILQLLARGPVTRRTLVRLLGPGEVSTWVAWLRERECAAWRIEVEAAPLPPRVCVVSRVEGAREGKVSDAGRRILDALQAAGGRLPVKQLVAAARVSRSAVDTLERACLVRTEYEDSLPRGLAPTAEPALRLTAAQRHAADVVTEAIRQGRFAAFVLHGVTGSGKTEVYIAAAAEAIERGLSVVCLVPEIALTAQMVARFKARFGDRVILFHSGLRPGERAAAWARAATGPAPLIIGPRSAVFAPVSVRLGLVVVDEEHDASYKQERDPRYNGRDVAIMRAHRASCPVLLGSATPSLETYHHCQTGKYTLLELPERVDGWAMPAVSIVDMRAEPKGRGPLVFSALLKRRIEEAVGRGEQALLLLNRRGYARSVQCAECGFIPKCPDCDVSLTFHRRDARHVCHYCGFAEPALDACPTCGGLRLGLGSMGTERLEDELRALIPGVRTLRMDRDTTRTRDAHVHIIDAMEREQASVLVGTQMIAKGLDLPKVTLVGVVNADTPLQFPDFRAGERAFQLLAQVAGRAGRSPAGGEVIMQSFLVDYPAILAAARHDYAAFATEELMHRREAGYPPFFSLVRIEVRGRSLQPVEARAAAIAASLRAERRAGTRFLGPAPPLLPRLRGLYRRHILAFGSSRTALHAWVKNALARAGEGEAARLVIDVDPLETV